MTLVHRLRLRVLFAGRRNLWKDPAALLSRTATITALLTVSILALTGCSDNTAAEPKPTYSPSASAAPTPTSTPVAGVGTDQVGPPQADGSRAKPFPYGTVHHISEDSMWDFTIHSPQADANTWVKQADQYNEAPAAGNTWVGANIMVKVRDIPEVATSTDPVSLPVSLSPVFVGSGGTIYDLYDNSTVALFGEKSWVTLPEVFVSPELSWDEPFAIQVPAAEADGGLFGVRHEITGKVTMFTSQTPGW